MHLAVHRIPRRRGTHDIDKEIANLRTIEDEDLAAFNRMLNDLNVPAVGASGEKR